MSKCGTLYIIAAASGTGKTSLTDALIRKMPNMVVSISHTTRAIRFGEYEEKDYFYVTKERFVQMINEGDFLEYAKVFGNYYGTSRKTVEVQIEQGVDIVLDIDWQGAKQIKAKMPCKTIFLLPPSKEELRFRLEHRGREGFLLIEERFRSASAEISHYEEFDYLVVNDSFEGALADLEAIVKADRLSMVRQKWQNKQLLDDLLRG